MKAIVYNKKALPDKLVYTDIEIPETAEHEVLVKIVAVSINAADYRSLKMGLIPKKKIFGADISGIVEKVGQSVVNFKPNDEVFADLSDYGFGGLAEYVAVPEKAVVLKPKEISFKDAASLPIAAITALQSIKNRGKFVAGHSVLIVGSGGGVGTFAVQLANYFGADVTAVCGTRNVEQSAALGATTVIDYTKEDFTKTPKRFDRIIAVNGSQSLFTYKRLLKPQGIYVMVGGSMMQIMSSLLLGWLFSMGSKKMKSLAAKSTVDDLAFLGELTAEQKIKPIIEKEYLLKDTLEAMQYISKGHAKGKIIITVE